MMSSSDGNQGTCGPKRRKRIITGARKEQNRIAQQLFRQRQRSRVQNRERHHHDLPGKHHQLRPAQPRDTFSEAGVSMSINVAGAAAEEESTQSNRDPLFCGNTLQPDYSRSLDPGCMMNGSAPGDEFNTDETLSLAIASTPSFFSMDSSMLINARSCGGTSLQTSSMPFEASEAEPGGPISATNFLDVPVANQDPLAMFDSLNWPAFLGDTPLSYRTPHHQHIGEKPVDASLLLSDLMQHSDYYQQDCTTGILEDPRNLRDSLMGALPDASLNQIRGVQRIIFLISKFLYGRSLPTSSGSIWTPSLPDPYINSIQCSQTATALAYFNNARCLGFDIEDLCISRSPFYHPNARMADDPQALLAAARKPWMPIHLQPTLPQILIPHHPYLDLIPFPDFRARVIMFAGASPQLFDPMDLKRDILKEGLYWDIRSWVAAPWFLKKWRLLMT